MKRVGSFQVLTVIEVKVMPESEGGLTESRRLATMLRWNRCS